VPKEEACMLPNSWKICDDPQN